MSRAGGPSLPSRLMDDEGNTYLGVPDFKRKRVKVQITTKKFSDEADVTLVTIPLGAFKQVKF